MSHRILLVGLSTLERDALRAWFVARGHTVWYTDRAIGALRTFEEVTPDIVVIDSLCEGMDAERLAGTLRLAAPSLRVVFMGQHVLEAAWFTRDGSFGAYVHRPVDPEEILGRPETEGPTLGAFGHRGEADALGLCRLLAAAARAEIDGTLMLGHGAAKRIIHLRNGTPAWVDSRIVEENLGHMLLSWNVIDRVQFEWARRLQLNEGIRQGEALVKIGVITDAQLEAFLRRQVEQKLINAFSDTPIPWRFDEAIRGTGRAMDRSFNPVFAARQALRQLHDAFDLAIRWSGRADQTIQLIDDPALRPWVEVALPDGSLRALRSGTTLANVSSDRDADDMRAALTVCEQMDLLATP